MYQWKNELEIHSTIWKIKETNVGRKIEGMNTAK
jgi:hypothetical protein